MSSPMVLKKLTAYGKSKGLSLDPREVLYTLYVKESMSLADIAALLKVTRPGVAYQVKALGLPIQPPGRRAILGVRARRLGYRDLEAYFHSNGKKSFEAMSEELHVTPETIRRHYDEFVARVQSGVAS
jgi:hypothetical protein